MERSGKPRQRWHLKWPEKHEQVLDKGELGADAVDGGHAWARGWGLGGPKSRGQAGVSKWMHSGIRSNREKKM